MDSPPVAYLGKPAREEQSATRSQTLFLCGVAVRLVCQERQLRGHVWNLWRQLFPVETRATSATRPFHLEFHTSRDFPRPPANSEAVYNSPHLLVVKTTSGFFLRGNSFTLDLDFSSDQGLGSLSDEFWGQPFQVQREVFLVAFLLVLRRHGRYPLHANSVVNQGRGFLLVGPPGCGKTTLNIALVRQGWGHLSDGAVMLKKTRDGVEALAFRQGFACTPETVQRLAELNAPGVVIRPLRDDKKLVGPASFCPGSFASECRPRVILFPQIASQQHSRLVPMDETAALLSLIPHSGGILTDHESVTRQLEVLNLLAHQARSYRLLLGTDVYQDPESVSQLLVEAGES